MISYFKKKLNLNKSLPIAFIILVILSYLFVTSIQQKAIDDYYQKWTYFDKDMKNRNLNILKKQGYDKNEITVEKKDLDILLKKYDSYQSDNQNSFLEAEIKNQHLNQELTDSFHQLDYKTYIKGKVDVNRYLIRHNMKLKSIASNTSSMIFTMNVLEFLNTPLFFLLFFLLMPIDYLKKYEDGRIKFLLVQPIVRMKIILEDFKIFFKKSSFILGTITIFSMSFSYIFSHQIDFFYPIQMTLLGKTHIFPIWLYLLILIFTFYFVGTFIFFCLYFLLLLFKNTMTSLIATIFICIVFNAFANQFPQTIDVVNPFSYVNVEKLCKSSKETKEIKYLVQTDRNLGENQEDMYVGNVVENPFYYANFSLAKRTSTVDLSLLPMILVSYSLILYFGCNYLLKRYHVS